MARPRKTLTPDQINQIEALASVLTQEQIADYLGVSRSTFNLILSRDEKVLRQYKKGKAKAIASIAGNLVNKARKGDTTAAIFYLKTQAGWKEQKDDDKDEEAQPMTFNFNVNDARGDIEITKGDK